MNYLAKYVGMCVQSIYVCIYVTCMHVICVHVICMHVICVHVGICPDTHVCVDRRLSRTTMKLGDALMAAAPARGIGPGTDRCLLDSGQICVFADLVSRFPGFLRSCVGTARLGRQGCSRSSLLISQAAS
jgi:hypothetical protein